jgi:hypothetical protein
MYSKIYIARRIGMRMHVIYSVSVLSFYCMLSVWPPTEFNIQVSQQTKSVCSDISKFLSKENNTLTLKL